MYRFNKNKTFKDKKIRNILSIILIVLGAIYSGIFLLFVLFCSFICGKPFYVINGGEGPILNCTSVFNTDLILPILSGICLVLIGILLLVLSSRKFRVRNDKNQ